MKKHTKLDAGIWGRILDFKPRKSDVRRMEILSAVIDAIATDGVHNLNTLTISKQSKIQRSLINYYFPNHQKMVLAAIQYVVAISQEIVVSALVNVTTPQDQLTGYVDATFSWFERFPKHGAVMSLLYYYSGINPAYRKLLSEVRNVSEERIAAILMSKKGMRHDAKRAAIHANLIRDYLVGSLLAVYGGEEKSRYDEHRNRTRRHVLAFAKEYWNG